MHPSSDDSALEPCILLQIPAFPRELYQPSQLSQELHQVLGTDFTESSDGTVSTLQQEVFGAVCAVVAHAPEQELVLPGTCVTVDIAVVGRLPSGREVPIALEVQGRHHYTSKLQETRASAVSRLLRAHAGWNVVAISFMEWQCCLEDAGAQQELIRRRLFHAWPCCLMGPPVLLLVKQAVFRLLQHAEAAGA